MRYFGVIAVVLLLAGASAASSAARSPHQALVLNGAEFSGSVMLGSPPGNELGELLRFVPQGRFQIGLVLANRSRTVVVTGAQVVEPRGTLVHQIGAHFHRYSPPKGPVRGVFPMSGHAHRPRPFTMLRGKSVGVELDFRLGSCADIRSANPAPITRLRVTFHTPHGQAQERTFSLRSTEPRLRMPKPGDCAQPRSSLSVNGPQKWSSSSNWTIPGSPGDVCTIRHGSLDFVSREYQIHIWKDYSYKHWERVALHLDHFQGPGAYQGVMTVTTAGGKVVLHRSTRNVEVTRSTPREIFAIVQAGRLPKGAVRGTVRCRIAHA